jgi:hypothetical protein
MVALIFFRTANQPRSAFRDDGTETVDDRRCVRVSFTEQARPRVIASPDEAPARGSACIESDSGRILETEFRMRSAQTMQGRERAVDARISVTYRSIPRLDLWLPTSMDEFYQFSPGGIVRAHAEYAAFRRFEVQTTADVDMP